MLSLQAKDWTGEGTQLSDTPGMEATAAHKRHCKSLGDARVKAKGGASAQPEN